MHTKIEQTISCLACELAHTEAAAISLPEAMVILQEFGEPNTTNAGVHSWYGNVCSYGADGSPQEGKPFTLSIDEDGNAIIHIAPGDMMLLATALRAALPDAGTGIIQTRAVRVPSLGDFFRRF